jgi:hypothetical protein
MVGYHIAKSTGQDNRNPADLSPLTVPGVPTDPHCGSRARLIRYQNQLESNLAVVEAGKSSLRALLQPRRCLEF